MAEDDQLLRELYELEQRLQQSDERHSRQSLEALLSEDFIEIGSAGRVYNRSDIIEALASESGVRIEISEFSVTTLSPTVVLVRYRAAISEGDSSPVHSLRSSVWLRSDNHWRMVFHQGTPIDDHTH